MPRPIHRRPSMRPLTTSTIAATISSKANIPARWYFSRSSPPPQCPTRAGPNRPRSLLRHLGRALRSWLPRVPRIHDLSKSADCEHTAERSEFTEHRANGYVYAEDERDRIAHQRYRTHHLPLPSRSQSRLRAVASERFAGGKRTGEPPCQREHRQAKSEPTMQLAVEPMPLMGDVAQVSKHQSQPDEPDDGSTSTCMRHHPPAGPAVEVSLGSTVGPSLTIGPRAAQEFLADPAQTRLAGPPQSNREQRRAKRRAPQRAPSL
jgi:hypothetical protein